MASPSEWLDDKITGIASTCAGLSLAGTLLGFCGRFHWLPDLFSHFRFQYLIVFLISAPLFTVLGRKRLALASTAAGMLLASTLLPYYLPQPAPAPTSSSFKILSFNVHTRNNHYQEVVDFLENENPDLLFLMEIDAVWAQHLEVLKEHLPHSRTRSREDNFGFLLMSRYPLREARTHFWGETGVPSIRADIEIGSLLLRFIGTHPIPPAGREGSKSRNQQLAALAHDLASTPLTRTIVAGDLNTTPFSHVYQDFLKGTGLKDSSLGLGLGPTWMRRMPWFAIPIDHVLVSPDITVLEKRVGPSLGSDHSPIMVKVGIQSTF